MVEYKALVNDARAEAEKLAQQAAATSAEYQDRIKLLKAVIRDSK